MEPQSQSLPRQFFEELKRRRVIRVATLYVLALWPIIQIVDILAPAIGLPAVALRYMLIIFIGGLPVALILSWLYDLNRGGVVRAEESGERSGHPLISRSAEITVITVLLLAIAVLFLLDTSLQLEEEPAPVASVTADPNTSSIAVLPFVSFSAEQEDELFSDGLTEELLNVLSQIKYLRVIARTTSFSYKGVNRNVQEIGQELGVDTILEGSVRRNDVENTIRVTAQLIDTESGTHLWSDTFDREFRDIFKIQDEIAAAVVRGLNLTLAEEETARLQSRATANPDAMMAFGMGRTALGRRTTLSLSDAARYFREATRLDPGYVDAHAELANTYSLQAGLEPARREELLALAQIQVDTAMALDDNNGSAWAAQGLIHMMQAEMDRDQADEAREALARAIELNPNLAMANMWYGNLMDDPAEQRRYHNVAFELDPRSPVAGYNLANDLMLAGRESEAMEIFSRIVEADPNYPGAYVLIAQLNEFRGRLGEALHHYEKVYQLQPTSQTAMDLAELWMDIGDFEQTRHWLSLAEIDLAPEARNRYRWLEVSATVAGGDRPAAELLMAKLVDNASETPTAHINSARAAYFMEDYAAAVAAFERLDSDDLPESPHGMDISLIETLVVIAFAYKQLGQEDEARALADRAEEIITRTIESRPRVDPAIWFALAQLNAIRGETNLALIHLQRAVDEGWRQHWRPMVEPSLVALVKEPAFGAMMQGLSTRMDLIREQIAFDNSFEQDWEI